MTRDKIKHFETMDNLNEKISGLKGIKVGEIAHDFCPLIKKAISAAENEVIIAIKGAELEFAQQDLAKLEQDLEASKDIINEAEENLAIFNCSYSGESVQSIDEKLKVLGRTDEELAHLEGLKQAAITHETESTALFEIVKNEEANSKALELKISMKLVEIETIKLEIANDCISNIGLDILDYVKGSFSE